jgi:hypothetical protein
MADEKIGFVTLELKNKTEYMSDGKNRGYNP